MTGRRDSGAVIVAVLLILLALTALAHGTLIMASAEAAAARAAARLLEARSARSAVLADELSEGLPPGADTLQFWDVSVQVRAAPPGPVTAIWTRLGRESWWLASALGSGRSEGPGLLLWALDPVQRVGELDAVLTVGRGTALLLGGPVTGSTDLVCPAPQGAATAPVPALPPVAATLDTVPSPRLGLLDLDEALALVPVRVGGVGRPAPSSPGTGCRVDDPWNWGDPLDPRSACGGFWAVRAATGDLTMSGGSGQGLLIVDGDLTLTGGARFDGLLLTSGRVVLEPGSSLRGVALAPGGARVAAGAEVVGSACAALAALEAARPYLGALRPVPGGARFGPWWSAP